MAIPNIAWGLAAGRDHRRSRYRHELHAQLVAVPDDAFTEGSRPADTIMTVKCSRFGHAKPDMRTRCESGVADEHQAAK